MQYRFLLEQTIFLLPVLPDTNLHFMGLMWKVSSFMSVLHKLVVIFMHGAVLPHRNVLVAALAIKQSFFSQFEGCQIHFIFTAIVVKREDLLEQKCMFC